MIKELIGLLLVGIIVVLGLSFYLSPNDIHPCATPGAGSCQPAGAIVVISGGDTEARTAEAVRLYHDGWAPLLVVSGAAADKSGRSNAAAMRSQAVQAGVPAEAIIMDEKSETTKQNAAEVSAVLGARQVRDIILVTSGYHMRRAQLEFAAQLPGVKVRAHPVASDKHWGPMWWATPWGWWLALGELVKIGLFAVGGSR